MSSISNIKSPFKFLDNYGKEDKDIFFGREEETYEFYDRVFETNLILLYGASGTGKTSLINCGLGNRFESTDWHPVFIRRQRHIIDSWYAELYKQMNRPEALKEERPELHELVHSLYLDYFKPIYLIFDQFEELFILGNKKEQELFFRTLADLLLRNLQCKVIISIREEYLANLSEFEYIVPSIFDNRLRIERMNAKNLREVIVKTTEAFDIAMPDGDEVARSIVDKLRDKNNQIDLANLQVYLDRLYRLDASRKTGDLAKRAISFDLDLVNQTGDLDDVMSAFLDEQLEVLENELNDKGVKQSGIPLSVLVTLVSDTGTKQPMELDDIKQDIHRAKGIEPEIIDYCVARFKEMRILRELSE